MESPELCPAYSWGSTPPSLPFATPLSLGSLLCSIRQMLYLFTLTHNVILRLTSFLIVCTFVHLCMYVCGWKCRCLQKPEKMWNSLELAFQMVMSCPTWVVGSPTRAADSLNHWANSLASSHVLQLYCIPFPPLLQTSFPLPPFPLYEFPYHMMSRENSRKKKH